MVDRKSTRLNSSHQINTLSLHDALPIYSRVLRRELPGMRQVAKSAGEVPLFVSNTRQRKKRREVGRCAFPKSLLQGCAGSLQIACLFVKHRELLDGRSEEHTSELQSPDQHSFPTRRSSDLLARPAARAPGHAPSSQERR